MCTRSATSSRALWACTPRWSAICATNSSPGDLALSCTDGLSNYLERDTLLLFISNYQGEELADELIRYANSKGGSDNVTVAVIENG